jgi:hypothetical protein
LLLRWKFSELVILFPPAEFEGEGKNKKRFCFSYTLYFKSHYALYLQERFTDYSTTLFQLPNMIVNMRMNGEYVKVCNEAASSTSLAQY